MMHAGLPTDVDWHNQNPVAIEKIAQVVSLKSFHFINYSLLHIAKAISRNKHLKCYKGNWVTIEIIKTLLKNQCSYQTHIRLSDIHQSSSKDIRSEDKREDDEWEEMYMDDNGGNREENGSGVNGDGEEEEEEEFEGKDDGGGEDGEEKEEGEEGEEKEEQFEAKERNGEGSSSAGKRKATQDDQPVAATRSKKRKVTDSKDLHVATQLRRKAVPKSKYSRKCKPLYSQYQ